MIIFKKSRAFLGFVLTFFMLISTFSGVTVVRAEANENLVLNPGFESDFEHWTKSGTVNIKGDNVHSGSKALDYWSAEAFNFTVSQTITGIENGIYSLSAFTQGGGGENSSRIFASGYGGDELTASFTNTAWRVWKQPTINNISVTNNTITIGVYIDANAGNWGTIDDFVLKRVMEVPQATIKPVTIFTNRAEAPVLPEKVTKTNSDGTSENVIVAWNDIDEAKLVRAGSFEVLGTIGGSDIKAKANIIVIEPLNIPTIENLPKDFIKGMDISMLKQVEDNGGKFYENGVEKDPLVIFKEHGVNWVRLRLWNNPAGKGGGENDLATTIELAKRAKALGLKFLLDFHYSDFWADPGTQTKPAAWLNLSGSDLENAVYNYTKDAITQLKNESALPDMVQIGNEINGGMLWPDGKTFGTGSGGYDGLARLLSSGVKGVKDSLEDSEDVKIMIHLAEGGENGRFRTFFDAITERKVEFDIIGLSFYPYWHGTLEELQHNADDISARYNKEVIVAETAYAYTLDNGDPHGNIFGPDQEKEAGYPATLQGQATEVRAIMDVMAKVPNGKGKGIFYWEGGWIPVEGAGWAAGEGNAWENQAFFDFKGNTLPSLKVFNAVSSGQNVTPIIIQIKMVSLSVEAGTNPTNLLPAKTEIVFSDGYSSEVDVTWDVIDPSRYASEGSFTVEGTIAESSKKVIAEIRVTTKQLVNHITNPGFESDLSGWTLTGTGASVKTDTPHSGAKTLHYWSGDAFNFTISQAITGLENGIYELSTFSQGIYKESPSLTIFAKNYGGEELSTQFRTNGWNNWQNPVVENIRITNGAITIGATVNGDSGDWGTMDDFKLVKVGELPISNPPVDTPPVNNSPVIVSIDKVNLSVEAGNNPTDKLPLTVKANYSDGSTAHIAVSWESIAPSKYSVEGSFTVKGSIGFIGIEAEANIVVKSKEEESKPQPQPQKPSNTVVNNTEDIIKALEWNENVTINMSTNKILDKSVLEAIKGTDKTITVVYEGVQWIFKGKDIVNAVKALDLTVSIAKLGETISSNRTAIAKLINNQEAIVVSFAENGLLPGKSTVKVKLDSSWLDGKDKFYVYFYNENNGKAELTAEKLKADQEGYIEFEITHNSDYFVIDKPISKDTEKSAEGTGSETETPKIEVPKTEVPKTEVPKTEAPKAELPRTGSLLDQTLLMIIGFTILTSGLILTVTKRKRRNLIK